MGAEGSRTLLPTCNVRSEASDTNIISNKNAIINTDVEQHRLTMRRRQVFRTQRDEINSLRQEVTEIKGLLKELINNNG